MNRVVSGERKRIECGRDGCFSAGLHIEPIVAIVNPESNLLMLLKSRAPEFLCSFGVILTIFSQCLFGIHHHSISFKKLVENRLKNPQISVNPSPWQWRLRGTGTMCRRRGDGTKIFDNSLQHSDFNRRTLQPSSIQERSGAGYSALRCSFSAQRRNESLAGNIPSHPLRL